MIRLSPSTLNLFFECKRCFWLHINKNIHRPRGIFPSLPSGMDNVIKKYFDKYRRQRKLPPEIEGKVPGKLVEDIELLSRWRNWRTGLEYKDEKLEATLFGALDDCLMIEQGGPSTGSGRLEHFYVPIDYKTRGFAPQDGASEKYYQNQLDCYALLLEKNGYPVQNFAYLIYYYPREVKENGQVFFNVKPIKIETDPRRALKTFEAAVALLRSEISVRHSKCEYCSWIGDVSGFD